MEGLLQAILSLVILISSSYTLQISIDGSRIAGSKLNITCTLLHDSIYNETDIIALILEKQDYVSDGSGDIAFNSETSSLEAVLNFDSLEYFDGGVYLCTAQFNGSTGGIVEQVAEYNLTVQIPLPSIQTTVIPSGQIFIGENVTLGCQIDATIFEISYVVTVIWQQNDHIIEEVMKTESNGAVYSQMFELEQTIQRHLEHYSCDVMIAPLPNDPFVTGVNYTSTITLSANDPPDIRITHSGTQNIGSMYYVLNCSINHEEFPNVTLIWYKSGYISSSGQISLTSDLVSTLNFQSLSLADAGVYTCKALFNERVIAVEQTTLLLTTPLNLTVDITTPFYALISWQRPLLTETPPTNFSVSANVSQMQDRVVTIPLSVTIFNITGLRPFQFVEVTVVVNTEGGRGEAVSIVILTQEYVPNAVDGLTIITVNHSSVLVQWNPIPLIQVNGILLGYELIVTDLTNTEIYKSTVKSTSAIITGLAAQMRYRLTIRAFNSQFHGQSNSKEFYTVEGVLRPPVNITVNRSITDCLLITWSGVTNPRGIVHSYLIMSGRGEMHTVPYNTTSLLLASVGDVYAFRIATVNEEGVMGYWSEWITNAVSVIIQLRGGPFKSCLEWTERDMNSIKTLFKQSILNVSQAHCNNCSTVVSNDILSCDNGTPTDAIYRTNITAIYPYTTTSLIEVITEWIMGGATIASGVTLINLNSQCPLVVATVNEPLCNSLITSSNAGETNDPSVLLLTSLLSTSLVLVCFLATVVVCTCVVWRAQRTQTWRFVPCPTPEGHPWVYSTGNLQHNGLMFTNASIEDFEDGEEEDNEGAGHSSEEGERSISQVEEEGSISRVEEERESGVYDPSNLTIIYESDHESSKL